MQERRAEIFEELEQIAILPKDWETEILSECCENGLIDLEAVQTWLEKNMILDEDTDLFEADCDEINCRAIVAAEVKNNIEKSEKFQDIVKITKLVSPQRTKIFSKLLSKINFSRISKEDALTSLLEVQLNEIKKEFERVVAAEKIGNRMELIDELIGQAEMVTEPEPIDPADLIEAEEEYVDLNTVEDNEKKGLVLGRSLLESFR